MSEKQSSVKINETHLGYIQAVINRMGQNSFQAKTWCITVICALLVFYLGQPQTVERANCIVIAIAAVILFGVLDVYYLYLERGYRQLYNIAAELKIPEEPINDYDMRIPRSERGVLKFFCAFLSPSTGLFYLTMIALLIVLWKFTSLSTIPST